MFIGEVADSVRLDQFWISDGTVENTQLLTLGDSLSINAANSGLSYFAELNGKLIFNATFDESIGEELYTFGDSTSTSLIDLIGIDEFEISPNPISEHITVSYKLDVSTIVSFDVLNQSGQVLKRISPKKIMKGVINHQKFDFSELQTGMYYLQLKLDSGHSLAKSLIKL